MCYAPKINLLKLSTQILPFSCLQTENVSVYIVKCVLISVITVTETDPANTSEITEITVGTTGEGGEEDSDQIVEVQSEEILGDSNVR